MNATGDAAAQRASLVLALLLLAYIFNFLDRQILGILAEPIKADLHLTDTQFGAARRPRLRAPLFGARRCRSPTSPTGPAEARVIAAALALWSAFTALCGIATGFWQLFLFRMGVGVGEAGGVAPSYALIADYFPPRAPRPGAGDLLARSSDRLVARDSARRLHRPRDQLARGFLHHGRRRDPARADPALRRSRSRAEPDDG